MQQAIETRFLKIFSLTGSGIIKFRETNAHNIKKK